MASSDQTFLATLSNVIIMIMIHMPSFQPCDPSKTTRLHELIVEENRKRQALNEQMIQEHKDAEMARKSRPVLSAQEVQEVGFVIGDLSRSVI